MSFFIKKLIKGFVTGTLSALLAQYSGALAGWGITVQLEPSLLTGALTGAALAVLNWLKHRKNAP